jgi:hypothetical protein
MSALEQPNVCSGNYLITTLLKRDIFPAHVNDRPDHGITDINDGELSDG